MKSSTPIIAIGIIGLSFIIAFGLFSFDVEVEPKDPGSSWSKDGGIPYYDSAYLNIKPAAKHLPPADFEICDDILGCMEYFLVHMICDRGIVPDEYHGTYAFEPDDLTIPVGKTVVWRNPPFGSATIANHDVTFDLQINGRWVQSPEMWHDEPESMCHDANGNKIQDCVLGIGEWEYTFLERGDFSYHCSIHPWMTGTVHVV